MGGLEISTYPRRNIARRTGALPSSGFWTSEMLKMRWILWMGECMMAEN